MGLDIFREYNSKSTSKSNGKYKATLQTDIWGNYFITYLEEDVDVTSIPDKMSNMDWLKNELDDLSYEELFEWDKSVNTKLEPSSVYNIIWYTKKEQGFDDEYATYTPTISSITKIK